MRGNLITAPKIASADFVSLATTEGENRVDPFLNEKTFDSAGGDIIRTNILGNLDYYRGGTQRC